MCFPLKVCLLFSLQLFHIELNGFDFQTSPLLCLPKFPFQHVKRPITELSITQLTSKRHKTSIDNSCSIGRCRNKWLIIHTIIPCLWWNKVSVIPVYEGKHIAQWSIIHTIIPLIDFYQLVIRSVWYLSMMWAHVNCGAIHMLRPFNGEIVEGVHTCLWCVLKLNVTWFFFSRLLLCFPLG